MNITHSLYDMMTSALQMERHVCVVICPNFLVKSSPVRLGDEMPPPSQRATLTLSRFRLLGRPTV